MKYTQHETADEVTLTPREPATATVILLHGLGADGWDFVPIVSELGLPNRLAVRFVFPHAPVRPVTVNNGYEMRAWFDIRSFTPEGRADAAGLAEATRRVAGYIRREQESGVPPERVVLACFSQGGAVALHAGLRHPDRLAGILAMSAYLPFPRQFAAEKSAANAGAPLLLCHGIHCASLIILEEEGALVLEHDFLKFLAEAGAIVDYDRKRAKFPSALVNECMKKAPKQVTFYARDPKHNVWFGGEQIYAHPTGGTVNVLDLESGKARPATLKDVEDLVRLVDALPNIHTQVMIANPSDVPERLRDVYAVAALLRNTGKNFDASPYMTKASAS